MTVGIMIQCFTKLTLRGNWLKSRTTVELRALEWLTGKPAAQLRSPRCKVSSHFFWPPERQQPREFRSHCNSTKSRWTNSPWQRTNVQNCELSLKKPSSESASGLPNSTSSARWKLRNSAVPRIRSTRTWKLGNSNLTQLLGLNSLVVSSSLGLRGEFPEEVAELVKWRDHEPHNL